MEKEEEKSSFPDDNPTPPLPSPLPKTHPSLLLLLRPSAASVAAAAVVAAAVAAAAAAMMMALCSRQGRGEV